MYQHPFSFTYSFISSPSRLTFTTLQVFANKPSITLEPDPSGEASEASLAFTTQAEHFYFIQGSGSLESEDWDYLPVATYGDESPFQADIPIDPVSALPRVLSRTQADGSTTHYIYGVGIAYQINSDGSTHTHHYDHLGNTIALTDDDRAVTDRIQYSPYGIVTHREGTTDTPFLYSGQQRSPNRLPQSDFFHHSPF